VKIEKKITKNVKFLKIKVKWEEIWKKNREFGRMEGEGELLKSGYEDGLNVRKEGSQEKFRGDLG